MRSGPGGEDNGLFELILAHLEPGFFLVFGSHCHVVMLRLLVRNILHRDDTEAAHLDVYSVFDHEYALIHPCVAARFVNEVRGFKYVFD